MHSSARARSDPARRHPFCKSTSRVSFPLAIKAIKPQDPGSICFAEVPPLAAHGAAVNNKRTTIIHTIQETFSLHNDTQHVNPLNFPGLPHVASSYHLLGFHRFLNHNGRKVTLLQLHHLRIKTSYSVFTSMYARVSSIHG